MGRRCSPVKSLASTILIPKHHISENTLASTSHYLFLEILELYSSLVTFNNLCPPTKTLVSPIEYIQASLIVRCPQSSFTQTWRIQRPIVCLNIVAVFVRHPNVSLLRTHLPFASHGVRYMKKKAQLVERSVVCPWTDSNCVRLLLFCKGRPPRPELSNGGSFQRS
jgi:hypothetical protein